MYIKERKIKLFFCHHSSDVGGAGLSGLNTLLSLPEDKYDVTVYCNTFKDNMANLFKDSGFKVMPAGDNSPVSYPHCVGSSIPFLSIRHLKVLRLLFRDYIKLKNIISQGGYDFIVVNSMTLFWIGKIAKKCDKKSICFFRETYIHGVLGFRTAVIKYFLSNYFDKIAFISEFEFNQSKKFKCNITTIHNMIDEEKFDLISCQVSRAKLGFDSNTFYVLYVGGFGRLKGALVLFKSISKITDDSIKFVCVGHEPNLKLKKLRDYKTLKGKLKFILKKDYYQRCIATIMKYKLENKILFYGSVDNIAPFFKACDLLVCPITGPHQLRPVFEAGYAKIPVIATSFPHIKAVDTVECCIFFENRNSVELANKIVYVKENYFLTENIVKNNYNNTTTKHNKKLYQEKIRELFSSD